MPPQREENFLPPAALEGRQGVEEHVRARLVERLKGTSAAYLPTTDEESGQDGPPQVPGCRKSKAVIGELRTADSTVVHWVTWPHEVIYSLSAQPAI